MAETEDQEWQRDGQPDDDMRQQHPDGEDRLVVLACSPARKRHREEIRRIDEKEYKPNDKSAHRRSHGGRQNWIHLPPS